MVINSYCGSLAATKGMEAKSVREQRVQLNGGEDGFYRV